MGDDDACSTCGHPRFSHFRTARTATVATATKGCGVVMSPGYVCSCTAFEHEPPPRPVPEDDHGSRGWEATPTGWRCTECHQEVIGLIDAAIDDAHVCAPSPPARSRVEAEAIPGIDPNVWEVVDTHAEWVKVPTDQAGCVAGEYLRRRAARLAGKDDENA